MVRTMLEYLVVERNGVKNRRRKELDQNQIATIEEFHQGSFFWHYLLNFNGDIIFLLQYIFRKKRSGLSSRKVFIAQIVTSKC